MNLNEIIDLERGPRSELIQWLQRRHNLLPDPICQSNLSVTDFLMNVGNHAEIQTFLLHSSKIRLEPLMAEADAERSLKAFAKVSTVILIYSAPVFLLPAM